MKYEESNIRFSAFDLLLQLPLFQGMSRDDLTEVVAHTKMDFSKKSAGHVVAHTDTPCQQLIFILKGDINVTTTAIDRHYSVSETLHAPLALQPERLFGLQQQYSHTYTTAAPCQLLTISKTDIMQLSSRFLIFRINLLNIIATQVQKAEQQRWHRQPEALTLRIATFLKQHCLYPAGEKTFHIRMNDLARELNDSRLNISHALNAMQAQGLLTLKRGVILIPQIEKIKHN